ncbi:MAG: Smr/MutS family protein [Proteobacteria bacterium]|nr:Smr/MutS family protein [Pseudomonadota bacterium]
MARLADLKALLRAREAAAAQPATPTHPRGAQAPSGAPAPARPHASAVAPRAVDPDVNFRAVMHDVKPLSTPARAARNVPAPAALPLQRMADEADALLASKFGTDPAPQAWDVGQEVEAEQTFVRPGIGRDVLAKLRRGHWSVGAELDLHGMNSTEAHDALADFLAEARRMSLRCVRVIHGKGLSSPGREPVLKGKVRRWLARWDDVLAYAEAPPHAGGGGAVLVLLQGPRSR